MKNKKIFIALNHYAPVNAAANYGFNFAKMLDRTAFFYGVEKVPLLVEPTVITGTGVSSPQLVGMRNVRKEAEQDLSKILAEAMKTYDKVEYAVDIGFPETTLIAKTEKEIPYMVILESTHEMSTLNEWFGTYETRLAENIEVPVLVLPKNKFWKPVEKISYIMDFNDHKVENMKFLSELAAETGAALSVLTISDGIRNEDIDKYNDTIDALRSMLNHPDVTFHRVFSEESAENVERLLENTDADWLAFEHKSQSFLERVFGDFNTKRLILQSEIPVLVF